MPLSRLCLIGLVLAASAISITCSEPAPERAATAVPSGTRAAAASPETPAAPLTPDKSDGQSFSDPTYAYSLRLPRDWEPVAQLAKGKVIRLSVVTPARNRFMATIDSLAQPVTRESTVESVGETYVDPIVMRFQRIFKLMDGARKTEDHSKADSMRLW